MANDKNNKTFTFAWKIDNYSPLFLKEGQPICSSIFTAKCLAGGRWYLELVPVCSSRNRFAVFYLVRTENENNKNLLVNYNVIITTASGNVTSFKGQELFSKDKNYSGYYEIRLEELTNALKNCEDTLSISCTITTNNPAVCNEVNGCEAITKIGVSRFSFVWNVEETIASDWTQTINCPYPDKCPIEIILTCPQENIVTDIRLLEDKPKLSRHLSGRLALLDTSGIERYSKSAKFMFKYNTKKEVWRFPFSIKKSRLKNRKHTFLKNGVFSLMCNFTEINRTDSMEIVKYINDIRVDSANFRVDNFSTLHSDLTAMFNDRDHSDVKLQTGSEEFPAHKFILASRSPVFSAMFKRNMVESQTGVVDISDVDAGTLKSFLQFLYTDTVSEMEYESASKLFIVADKYQVVSLKEKCSSFLMSVLSFENVCNVLCMADMVGHKLLKCSAIDFIQEHSSKILPSLEWCELIKSNCQLASEVLHKFSAILEKAQH